MRSRSELRRRIAELRRRLDKPARVRIGFRGNEPLTAAERDRVRRGELVVIGGDRDELDGADED